MESITVKDYMNKRPVTFSPDMPLSSALEKLLRSQQTGGPVVDANKRLVGFISEQDMLQQLLRDSYHCQDSHAVADCMTSNALAVEPEDSIIKLAEMMAPTKPKLYPVVDEGKLVGIITRRDVLRAISMQMGECLTHPV
ncbi:hypothetical protein BZG13_08490 [Salinivibrio sp. ML323]|uniref:CBS domain-containing protein n=1 Tax=Salinivibrio TaxID=51366 RepID=UPI000985D7B7|nr:MULTISPECIES: CBS domain-containing protein [Salinivibrio]OOE33898.1 hypothetical protein BZG04_12745 [Salinivibrio kushneri]OOE57943.1 hypothetical protein BZG13_08490 [Salinivibrio sp. ML323]OOE68563.1 hypothetical protein BZG14_02775 [Salinivibrio sp. IB282]WBA12684.1 CBS domain-containing protein [Salinivibrio kushneri]